VRLNRTVWCTVAASLALVSASTTRGVDDPSPLTRPGPALGAFTGSNTAVLSRVGTGTNPRATGGFAIPGEFAFVVPKGICENGKAPIQAYAATPTDALEPKP